MAKPQSQNSAKVEFDRFLKLLDDHEGQLPHEQEEKFFKDVEYIIEKITSLPEYYDFLGYDYGEPA